MRKKIDISSIFAAHLFWDCDYSKFDVQDHKALIIPRALYATTEDSFEEDIQKLETLYSKKEILSELESTKENISNDVCELVARRYHSKRFYRFKK